MQSPLAASAAQVLTVEPDIRCTPLAHSSPADERAYRKTQPPACLWPSRTCLWPIVPQSCPTAPKRGRSAWIRCLTWRS